MSAARPYLGYPPLSAIRHERLYQDHKWGGAPHDRNHTFAEWSLILGREVGEAMDALGALYWSRDDHGDEAHRWRMARSELIQVAAVCVAICEVLDADVALSKVGPLLDEAIRDANR
jgi:NTP pyrophosphatase (non-canonical NTP hydrolase)